jgi:MFS family permease
LDKVPKNDVVNIILVVNALVWYLCFFSFLKNHSGFVGNDLVIIFGINLLATCLAAILSTRLIQKIENRTKFIVYWLAIGVLLSFLPLLIGSSFSGSLLPSVIGPPTTRPFIPTAVSFYVTALVSGAIGLHCGLGFPILAGHYSATTKSANRAKVSGLIVFFTVACFTPVILLAQSPVSTAIVLTIWALCGLLAIVFLKPPEVKINKEEPVAYKNILETRSALLYLVPWLVFSIVNSFALPALNMSFDSELIIKVTILENVLTGIFAVLFGFAADYFGRKRLLFFGFTMLGLGYATLGLFPLSIHGLFFYTFADGIAWGVFTTLFLLTIWGDIAGKRDGEKFFLVCFLPYAFSAFLPVLFEHFFVGSAINPTSVFFFISFFLFIAVTPLYLVPETLSEKDKRDNVVKNYLKKAQKKVEKNANKKHQQKHTTPVSEDSENHEKV